MKRREMSIKFGTLSGQNAGHAEAVNVRLASDGTGVTATGRPVVAATLAEGERPVGTDIRNGREYLFVHDGTNVVLAGSRQLPSDAFSSEREILFATGHVAGIASAGDFTAVSTAEGIIYLHFDGERYTYVGGRIEFPLLAFGTTDRRMVSVPVGRCELESRYDNWNGRLSAQDTRTLGRAVGDAAGTLVRQMKDEGRCNGPVTVRAALLLADGHRIWSDEATTVVPDGATMQLTYLAEAEKGETVTVGEAELSCETWKPAVTLVRPGLGAWRPFVRALEIYVGGCPTVATDSFGFRCEQSQTGEPRYYVRLIDNGSASAESMQRTAGGGPLRLAVTISDIDSLMDGKMTGDRLTAVTDGVGGSLTGRTYALRVTDDGQEQDRYAPRLPQFTAAVLASADSRLFAGNVTFRLPEPPRYASMCDTATLHDETATATVAVRIRTPAGESVVSQSGIVSQWTDTLNGLIAYPHPGATTVEVIVTAGGKSYGCEATMSPSDDGMYARAVATGGKFRLVAVQSPELPSGNHVEISSPCSLLVTEVGSALSWAACATIGAGGITNLVRTTGTGTSLQFGRHPLYVFTGSGIYLAAFDSKGRHTGARLISPRTVSKVRLAAASPTGAVFVDTLGELCRVEGYKVKPTGCRVVGAVAVGHCMAYDEVWIASESGVTIVCADNTHYFRPDKGLLARQTDGHMLLYDSRAVYAPCVESADEQTAITLRTSAVALPAGTRVASVVWPVVSDDVDLRLTVYGENGLSCHGELLSRLTVQGNLRAPLLHRVESPPVRAIRLEVEGTVDPGTVVGPCRVELFSLT